MVARQPDLVGKGKSAEPRAFCRARSTDPSKAPFIRAWRTRLACLEVEGVVEHLSRMAMTRGVSSSIPRSITILRSSVAWSRVRSESWDTCGDSQRLTHGGFLPRGD